MIVLGAALGPRGRRARARARRRVGGRLAPRRRRSWLRGAVEAGARLRARLARRRVARLRTRKIRLRLRTRPGPLGSKLAPAAAAAPAPAGPGAPRRAPAGERVEPRDEIPERQQRLGVGELEQAHLDDQARDPAVVEAVDGPREAIEVLGDLIGADRVGLGDDLIVEVVVHVEQRVAAAGQLGHGDVAQVLQDRDRELHEVAAGRGDVLEPGEDRRRVAVEDRLDELGDGVAAGLAEHGQDLGGLDRRRLVGERDDLVEQRQRVADRALAAASDHVEALVLDAEALAAEDLAQVGDQRRGPDPAVVEPRDPREDRRQDLVRVRGREHEGHVRRRLLEGLEQRVEGRLREHVDLVDDVDLAPGRVRQVVDLVAERADVVDGVVARAVDLDHVDGPTGADPHALRALVAGLGRGPALADQALGEDPRRGRLAEAPDAAKQVGVMDPVGPDRVLERARDVLLADHVGEALRSILARECEVGHGAGTIADPRRPARRRGRGAPRVSPCAARRRRGARRARAARRSARARAR